MNYLRRRREILGGSGVINAPPKNFENLGLLGSTSSILKQELGYLDRTRNTNRRWNYSEFRQDPFWFSWINLGWLKSNPWPSALQLNYMIHCTRVPLRNKRTIKCAANALVHFSTHWPISVFFQRVSLLLFIFAPLVYFLLCPFLLTQKPSLIEKSNFLPTLYRCNWDKQFSFYTSVSLEIWLEF